MAIQRMPCCASSGIIAWQTDPSAGHMPRGGLPKMRCVLLDGPAHVDGGVLGIAAGVARQLHVRHRLAGQLLVEQQRQDRMVKRRRRQLDLAALGQLAGAAG